MDTVKILITGDICPIGRIEELSLKSQFKPIYNDFIDVFQGNNLNIVNLECPLTKSDSSRKKTGPLMKADPKCIDILKYADIKLVTLANNHILDYGSKGARQTIELCENAEINTVGIGESNAKTREPFVTTIGGRSFAFLNFADHEFLEAEDGSFQANAINPINNYYDIKKARELNDFIIVIVHGGNEYYHLPSPRVKSLYRYFVNVGADAVISHHTHSLSGYEIYDGKPIFYGLGNFIFDWPGRIGTGWNMGFAVLLKISDVINFDIVPLKQGNEKPGVFHLNESEKEFFFNELESLNQIIGDDTKLESSFNLYVKKVQPMYDSFIEPSFGRLINALRNRKMFPKLMSKRKRLLLLNLLRCESHRDVLLRMLSKNN